MSFKEIYARQAEIEQTYDRALIFNKALADLMSEDCNVSQINYGAVLLQEWLSSNFYEGKAARLAHVALLDLFELSANIHTEIMLMCVKPRTLVSVSAKCAGMLKMADKHESIQTMAEVISVLRGTGMFSIFKSTKEEDEGSYMVDSGFLVAPEIQAFIDNASYLPPMILKPLKLRKNRDSGYITQKNTGDSLILGGFIKHHNWDICLDFLNLMNSNEFEIDEEFLKCAEEPLPKLKVVDEAVVYISRRDKEARERAIENFPQYKAHCKALYDLLIAEGNSIFFNHKVDARGRVYSCGYHLSPQGNSFKKGMLSSKKHEIPTGVSAFMEQCK